MTVVVTERGFFFLANDHENDYLIFIILVQLIAQEYRLELGGRG